MTTIKDVAARAGVSIATVSRVINSTAHVTAPTKQTVMDAIQELRFTPNVIAQGLQKRQTRTIGLIFPDASSSYFAEIIRGIQSCVREEGYQVVISSSHDEEDEARTFMSMSQSGRVDGMILMMPSTRHVDSLNSMPQGAAMIFISAGVKIPGSPVILIDNYRGASEMTRHLIEHGHTQIGFIHGALHNYDSQERYRGFIKVIHEYKLDDSQLLQAQGNFTESSGFKAAMELLSQKPGPTAIFAANDAMAIGAIEAAKRLDLQVPRDVAIVGFDDISTARYMNPALTTIRVPVYDLGRIAGHTLFDRMRAKQPPAEPQEIVIPVEIQIRESCGCSLPNILE